MGYMLFKHRLYVFVIRSTGYVLPLVGHRLCADCSLPICYDVNEVLKCPCRILVVSC